MTLLAHKTVRKNTERVTVFCAAKNGGSEARSDARVTIFCITKNRNERDKTKNQSKDAKQLLIGEEEQGSVRMLLFLCARHKNKTEQWIFKKPTKSAQQFLLEEEEQWSG